MNLRALVLLVAVALPLASSAVATAAPTPVPAPTPAPKPSTPPPPKFPCSSDAFRKFIDGLLTRMHQVCDSECDAKGRASAASAESKVRSRTLDACRDGTVTEAEATWVLAPMDDVE